MNFEEKLAALWDDPGSRELIFIVLNVIFYGTMVLGYLIIIYLLFGLTAVFYISMGVVAAGLLIALYLLFGQRLIKAVTK